MKTPIFVAIILGFSCIKVFSQTPTVIEIMTKYGYRDSLDDRWIPFDSLRVDTIDLFDESIQFYNGFNHVVTRTYRGDSVVSEAIYNDMGMLARLTVNERDYKLLIKTARDGLSISEVIFHNLVTEEPRKRHVYDNQGILMAIYIQLNDTCESFERYSWNDFNKYDHHSRDRTGLIESTGCLCNGEFDGEIKTYYPNGRVQRVENWKNERRNGLSQHYSDEGLFLGEAWFEDGFERWRISHSEEKISYRSFDREGRLLKVLTLDKTAGDPVRE